MKNYFNNFCVICLIFIIFFILLGVVIETSLWAGDIIVKCLYYLVDYLHSEHGLQAELVLGIVFLLVFLIIPLTIFVTKYNKYWSE